MELQPLKTFRASTNQASLLTAQGRQWLVKRYAGAHQQERRDCEEQTLRLWNKAGFRVPRIASIDLPELHGTPYLVMEYLDGPTLQEYLRRAGGTRVQKLEWLSRILRENCRRQALALREHQTRLFHPDPNSSNVILVGSEFCFIDFETSVAQDQFADAAAIETAKFCRWTARDLGIDTLPELMNRLVEAYHDDPLVLRRIVRRTQGRPFQFFHRWQDRKRKRKQPTEVTKYDIADALAQALANTKPS